MGFYAGGRFSGTVSNITETQYAFTRVSADLMFRNYKGVLKVDGEVGRKKNYQSRSYLTTGEAVLAERMKHVVEELWEAGASLYKS